jgi:hypothetical protein
MTENVKMRLYIYDCEFKAIFKQHTWEETEESYVKHPGVKYFLKKNKTTEGKWALFKGTEFKRHLTDAEAALLG